MSIYQHLAEIERLANLTLLECDRYANFSLKITIEKDSPVNVNLSYSLKQNSYPVDEDSEEWYRGMGSLDVSNEKREQETPSIQEELLTAKGQKETAKKPIVPRRPTGKQNLPETY